MRGPILLRLVSLRDMGTPARRRDPAFQKRLTQPWCTDPLGGARNRPGVAAHAAPPQPEARPRVGAGGEAGRPPAPQAEDPPPLAAAALRRQAPEVGEAMGRAART